MPNSEWGIRIQAPDSKHQIPNNFQCPKSQIQNERPSIGPIGYWNLKIIWDLGFGIYALAFRTPHSALRENPCPPSLLRLPFLRKSELVARKQGRCVQKASAGKELPPEIPPCFRRNRRAHRAPGRAPLHRTNPAAGQRQACPPDPGNEVGLMIFARNALAFGPGTARNSIGLTAIAEK